MIKKKSDDGKAEYERKKERRKEHCIRKGRIQIASPPPSAPSAPRSWKAWGTLRRRSAAPAAPPGWPSSPSWPARRSRTRSRARTSRRRDPGRTPPPAVGRVWGARSESRERARFKFRKTGEDEEYLQNQGRGRRCSGRTPSPEVGRAWGLFRIKGEDEV